MLLRERQQKLFRWILVLALLGLAASVILAQEDSIATPKFQDTTPRIDKVGDTAKHESAGTLWDDAAKKPAIVYIIVPLIAALLGALGGSYATFLVQTKIESRKQQSMRWSQHWNACISVQYGLNSILNTNHANKLTIEKTLMPESAVDSSVPAIFRHTPLVIPKSLPLNPPFLRSDLIYDLFVFQENIRKYNADIVAFVKPYCSARDRFELTQLEADRYDRCCRDYVRGIKLMLDTSVVVINKQTIELLLKIRVALKLDNVHNKSLTSKSPTLAEISEAEIKIERPILEKEIQSVQSDSEKKMTELTGSDKRDFEWR